MLPVVGLLLMLQAMVGVLAIPSPSPNPDPTDFDLTPAHVAVMRRAAGVTDSLIPNYNQNYKTGGNVQVTPATNGYSVTFKGAQDFVVGRGWTKGDGRNVTFTGSTTVNSGTGLVAIYGWMTKPLCEYYIQEYANGNGAAQGQRIATVFSDGSQYNIWKHTQVNQPSIVGTTNFVQFISQRVNARPDGGTVTVQNHFDAWAKAGLQMGEHDYQVLATEGWGNANGRSNYVIS